MINEGEVADFLEQELASAERTPTADLYHYTSSEAAICGILANRTIRMSPFAGTNDLWESRPFHPSFVGEIAHDGVPQENVLSIWEDVDRYIRGHSKVACFTRDWSLPDSVFDEDALRGWSHLSMWAHYGAGHTGVCLRFDRDKLMAAFESCRGTSIHQFCGPVSYSGVGGTVGLHPISLAQAEEFGLDAVAHWYANLNHDQIYFRKHADWVSESEFRLVRTDQSTEPHYIDITEALTGIVLGEAFPDDRLPALFTMLVGFDKVEVLKARFLNRRFLLFPMDPNIESTVVPKSTLTTTPRVPSRCSGNLAQRMGLLEDAERIAKVNREVAKQTAAPLLHLWVEGLVEPLRSLTNWPGVVFQVHRSSTAIPPEYRRSPPGVPGEVISYEDGLMVVGEHQPQPSFTWVMAIALQLMPNGAGRAHACITTEERVDEGNDQQELYRDRRDMNPDEVVEVSSQVLADLIEAIPAARARFDRLRRSGQGGLVN